MDQGSECSQTQIANLRRESQELSEVLCVWLLWINLINIILLSHSFTLFTYSPYKAKGQVKINHKMQTDLMHLEM